MNIIYKYRLEINAADVTVTNAAIAADGAYEGAIAGYDDVGVVTGMASNTMGMGLIPAVQATYEKVMETSKVYDIVLVGTVSVTDRPHIYKIPLSILGADDTNQKVNSVDFLNIFDPTTGDIFPLTDRFFYKYNFAKKAIFFGFPHTNRAAYNGKGLKLQLSFISTKI